MALIKNFKLPSVFLKKIFPITLSKREIGNIYCTNEGHCNAYDFVFVGGGIVGCATARELQCRHPNLKIAILEKETKLAVHQSGNNSGVIHAGIYYKPGSLKAKLCVEGLHLSYKYLDEKGIPYKKVGKLIVATNEKESSNLLDLYDRGLQNGVPDLKLIDGDEIPDYEPYCKGVKALHSPHTGIVNWALVTDNYAQDFRDMGGDIYLNFKVVEFEETEDDADYPITIPTDDRVVKAKYVLTCAGLQSDIMAELTGCKRDPRIVPFRGEFLLLKKELSHMVRGNIYPVPDPKYPFLGVHFTPRMDGSVWVGPNAVLAFQREGYKWSDVNFSELIDAIKYPGFIKMASKNLIFGFDQILKSAFISLQTRDLQKFIPYITANDIIRGPAGVRAQAMDLKGNLVDDFIFDRGHGDDAISRRVIHCRNAPSPAATSSLSIAIMIVDKIEEEFLG